MYDRNRTRLAVVLLCLGFVAAWPALAEERHVPIPYTTIQEAIDACNPSDTVVVADGTYTDAGNKNLDFGGEAITVRSEYGPDNCIIDCEQDGRGFYFHTGESDLSVVDGFTIQNGFATTGHPGGFSGGGILNVNSHPTVIRCIFRENRTDDVGGGMANLQGSCPKVTSCTFVGNLAADGGGMWNQDESSPTLTNCVFEANSVYSSYNPAGGGICNLHNSSPILYNCKFIGNTATNGTTWCYGGAVGSWFASRPTLTNCTFFANMSDDFGGAVYNSEDADSPMMVNCILWGNTAPAGSQIYGAATVAYSCVQGGWPGEGNIDTDPLFFPANSDDYHLMPFSPCIDAGDTTAVPADLFVDLDGLGRRLDHAWTADTGVPVGLIPVTVDMGAYEYHVRRGDINCDGDVNAYDIDGFILCVGQGYCDPCP
ncbi:MAG: right-handed parallel beta-helix repeat-containing protein [Planctomycetota bacterium]